MEMVQSSGVKVYFINPIDSIYVVINTLVEIEYEAYTINETEKYKLLKILKENDRNVIFICIQNVMSVTSWIDYIDKLKKIEGTVVQVGAFVYDRMNNIIRDRFLRENVAVINFGEIKKNTFNIMKKIMIFFEAMGKRPYITTNAYGPSEVYFYIKNREKPIVGKIQDISAYALTCHIEPTFKPYFGPGTYYDEAVLILKGSRIKTGLSVVGFSRDDPNKYMLKFCTTRIYGKNMACFVSITPEMSHKLHEYIRWCLKEGLRNKFKALDEGKRKT